ncbi:glycosyltransferase [Synechococcus sp. MIT S1220]|uniref:glycosyltransferase n=1 Tax=Synechococcus sp. MIT S1220 TaxID=3082549 RepID=UPI0039AEB8FA
MEAVHDRGHLMVFAPTRRAVSETFIRANLARLPFRISAYFGDERPWFKPLRLLYGLAILLSKVLTRLRLLRAAGLPASGAAMLLIQRDRPALVLAEFGFEAVRVMEACRWSRLPLVVHFRGSDASAEERIGVLSSRYKRLFSIADGVIVKSNAMAERLIGLGARRERIIVSPSGADSELFHGSAPSSYGPLLLAVGRFVAKKGPLQTLEAFRRCLLQLGSPSEPMLWMVGEGPLLTRAMQFVAEQNLQGQVRFLGCCGQREVAALMRQARAFVQHSCVAPNGDSEGSPVAVMEAQLSGLPVIATRHAGIPDVVIEGETGLLVEEGDEEAMAMAMLRLINDPELAERFGRAGRQRVLKRFTVAHHLQQVTDLLDRVQAKAAAMPCPPL